MNFRMNDYDQNNDVSFPRRRKVVHWIFWRCQPMVGCEFASSSSQSYHSLPSRLITAYQPHSCKAILPYNLSHAPICANQIHRLELLFSVFDILWIINLPSSTEWIPHSSITGGLLLFRHEKWPGSLLSQALLLHISTATLYKMKRDIWCSNKRPPTWYIRKRINARSMVEPSGDQCLSHSAFIHLLSLSLAFTTFSHHLTYRKPRDHSKIGVIALHFLPIPWLLTSLGAQCSVYLIIRGNHPFPFAHYLHYKPQWSMCSYSCVPIIYEGKNVNGE